MKPTAESADLSPATLEWVRAAKQKIGELTQERAKVAAEFHKKITHLRRQIRAVVAVVGGVVDGGGDEMPYARRRGRLVGWLLAREACERLGKPVVTLQEVAEQIRAKHPEVDLFAINLSRTLRSRRDLWHPAQSGRRGEYACRWITRPLREVKVLEPQVRRPRPSS